MEVNIKIAALAAGSENITLLGYQSFEVLKSHMQRAKAFVFAAEEDFGITPVEAQASGTPVIAFGKGGALETVRPLGCDAPTGVFFNEQSVSSLCAAIDEFEANCHLFTAYFCRTNAERFPRPALPVSCVILSMTNGDSSSNRKK